MLQPWAGHRRGAIVAVPRVLAMALQRRRVLEIAASTVSHVSLQTSDGNTPPETPVQATDAKLDPEPVRRRGRPPRAK